MKKAIHILLDGADGTGKSSIALRLQTATGFPIIKMPNMKEYIENGSPEEFSRLFNETIVQFKDTNFIMDRGYTSSLVYSKIFNRTFDLTYLDEIEKQLDPLVFILTRQKQNYREDEIFDKEKVAQLDLEYTKLANKKGYRVIDTSNCQKREVTDKILKVIINELNK